jgi:arginyl-tRNA synthetase
VLKFNSPYTNKVDLTRNGLVGGVLSEILDELISLKVLPNWDAVTGVDFFPRRDASVAIRSASLPQNPKNELTSGLIQGVEIIGNYANLRLSVEALGDRVLSSVERAGTKYGFDDRFSGKELIIEHTSINPVYPINVATFRSSVIGNALASLYSSFGATVETHFWVEALSRQLSVVVNGMRSLNMDVDDLRKTPGKNDHTIGAIFAATLYEARDSPLAKQPELIPSMFPLTSFRPVFAESVKLSEDESSDPQFRVKSREICNFCLEGLKQTLSSTDIEIDCYDVETEHLDTVNVSEVVNSINQNPRLRDLLKRVWEQSSEPNYLIRNIAYFLIALRRCSQFVSVVSMRQKAVLQRAAEITNLLDRSSDKSRLTLVFFGDVLNQHGKADSISAGIFHDIDSRIASDAASLGVPNHIVSESFKFSLLKCCSTKTCQLDFSSPSLHSDFLGVVKAITTLNHAVQNVRSFGYQDLPHEGEIAIDLLKLVSIFPLIIEDVFKTSSFHALARYIMRLSKDSINYLQWASFDESRLSPRILSALLVVSLNALRAMGIRPQGVLTEHRSRESS